MTRRSKAIAYIQECRRIHVEWIDGLKRGDISRAEAQIGGGVSHHRKWVRRYDAVLRELEIRPLAGFETEEGLASAGPSPTRPARD